MLYGIKTNFGAEKGIDVVAGNCAAKDGPTFAKKSFSLSAFFGFSLNYHQSRTRYRV